MSNATQFEFKPLTSEELERTEEFNGLTPKQRLWVRSFIESKDYLFATKSAYDSKNTLNAQILSHKIRRCPEVIAAVRLCLPEFGDVRAARDLILDALQKKLLQSLRNRKSVLTVAEKDLILKLFTEKGWDLPESLRRSLNTHGHAVAFSPESTTDTKSGSKIEGFKVGDIFEYEGTPTRITALDANGRPTDGDPLEGAELKTWLANKSKAGAQ